MIRNLVLGLVFAVGSPLLAQVHPEGGDELNTGKASPQDNGMPLIADNDKSPYHAALLNYKEGKYQEALDALNGAGVVMDTRTAILKSLVLTELKQYDEGEKVLREQLAGPDTVKIQGAMGDLFLRKRNFSRAVKYYQAVLKANPDDPNAPDTKLKLIYADIGSADIVTAAQLASELNPLDPKKPYDQHASYYFAQAALAQASGKTQEAQDQIQLARTNYGITVTNRYLKTYLQVFESQEATNSTDITPPPRMKATAPAPAKK